MSVAAIILAAGASQRLGQPKQLLAFRGEFLLRRAIRTAQESGAAPVYVVLGANREQICEAVPLQDVTVVINPQWQIGMSTSIHAGLAEAEKQPEVTGVILMSCDQPRLSSAYLRTMIDTVLNSPANAIVASTYAGATGVPALFPRLLFGNLHALRGEQGARSLLTSATGQVVQLPFEGGELDIDTPEDLANLT